ncbi:transcriptional regulator domain-containing protein, partial [Hyphomonas sp. UBA3201]
MPSDWRDDKQYDHFDDLGVSGLAWECLRRNSRYRDD